MSSTEAIFTDFCSLRSQINVLETLLRSFDERRSSAQDLPPRQRAMRCENRNIYNNFRLL
jgi:hypothetical protein